MTPDVPDVANIYISTPLYDYPQLRILSGKLFRAGIQTLGDLAKLSERDLMVQFRTSADNVARVNDVLSEFGLTLKP